MRHTCAKTGALLIADEVQSGLGRTGQPFYFSALGLKPHLVSVGKALGANPVILTDIVDSRLAVGTRVGADVVINASAEPVVDAVRRLTNGRGANLVFECSGAPNAVNDAIHMLKRGGRVCLGAFSNDPALVDVGHIVTNNIYLYGIRGEGQSAVRRAASIYGAVVLLKGADTLVAAPRTGVHVAGYGQPSLATAGSGDVLTGVIAAFLAKGLEPQLAAAAGAVAHGLASRLAEPQVGLVASDLLPAIRRALAGDGWQWQPLQ